MQQVHEDAQLFQQHAAKLRQTCATHLSVSLGASLRASAARLLATMSRPSSSKLSSSSLQSDDEQENVVQELASTIVHSSFRALSHVGSKDPDPRVRTVHEKLLGVCVCLMLRY